MFFSVYFTNHNFSQPIAIHATFFSMQVALALVYILSVFIKERLFYRKLFYLCCCAILSMGMIQLGSKSVFIALIVVINIAVPFFLLQGARRRNFILISAAFTILVVAGMLTSGNFRDRYIKGFKNDLSKSVIGETDDTRLARWNVSLGLISKFPVFGYGAGSEISLLQDGFFNNKLYSSYLNRLNTHSEYLSFLLKSGIIGLSVYLATLAFGFNVSVRRKDLLFLAFMAIITFVSTSENLLDVDKGIIFYAFFFSFFTFSHKEQNNIPKSLKINLNNQIKATKQLVAAS
jgi:O-antigen ligase